MSCSGEEGSWRRRELDIMGAEAEISLNGGGWRGGKGKGFGIEESSRGEGQ